MLNGLYESLAKEGEAYDLSSGIGYTSRKQVVNKIKHMAPFNLIDGVWLSNSCPAGPIDEVHSMLWGILNDEMGFGDAIRKHATLYKNLLEQLEIYFPPLATSAFSTTPDMLPSAFTQPACNQHIQCACPCSPVGTFPSSWVLMVRVWSCQ